MCETEKKPPAQRHRKLKTTIILGMLFDQLYTQAADSIERDYEHRSQKY
jgi:hypothetical protein